MKHAQPTPPALSFEQAPPISVPFRFFLTAPLFGAAAGLLLLWQPAAVLASRWTPASLALVHLLGPGFMLQIMCGALLQMLPVVVGANVWQPRRVTALTHAGLTLGTLLLVLGFLSGSAWLFQVATPLLGAALGGFAIVVLVALLRTPAEGPTILVIRLAVVGLLVAVALGATLGASFGWQIALPPIDWVDLHAAWALVGWGLLLVIGVALLVVPMFQLTPPYPARAARAVPIAIFALVSVWSLGRVVPTAARTVIACAVATLAIAFAAATLWLQSRRRRKIVEATLLFWRLSMIALAVAGAAFIVFAVTGRIASSPTAPYVLGVLTFVGVFGGVISGMLYRIVPFLSWLHLQKFALAGLAVPNARRFLGERPMRVQLYVHALALALLLAAAVVPAAAYAGGAALAISFVVLERNILRASLTFMRTKRDLEAKLPTAKPEPGPGVASRASYGS